MQLYAVLGRDSWRAPADLKAAAERSGQIGAEMEDEPALDPHLRARRARRQSRQRLHLRGH
jgi:hypothetical protein